MPALGRRRSKKGRPRPRKRRGRLTARNADKHVLYEKSVQCPEADVDFLDQVFQATYGRAARRLREDFCGTAALCCEWVRRRPDNEAAGVDLDASVIQWGKSHNVDALEPAAGDRVRLLESDVLRVNGSSGGSSPEIVVALNFSYFVFKERVILRKYFEAVRASLAKESLFVLDLMGGPEAQIVQEEETENDSFSYVWDQDAFNPVTHDFRCHIHFRFPDGSELREAFTYDWRLWTLAELRDVLAEAGFAKVDAYWEGTDEDGEGDGDFEVTTEGDDSEAWIAYVVATP